MTGVVEVSRLPPLRAGYQTDAVEAITAGLVAGGRGQMVAACGTGKTLVAVHAALRLAGQGTVVVSCPSLALVAQTLRVWSGTGVVGGVVAVCSDDTVADAAVSTADLWCQVSTDAVQVAEWTRRTPAGRLRLVLTTHLSAAVVGAGLRMGDLTADLLVIDEAHRTAGLASKAFGQLHHDEHLPARRRLYMTATPRILAAGRRGRVCDDRASLSMDDQAVFGPVLFRYPFGAAIDDGWLDDFQVLAIGVTEREVLDLLRGVDPNAVTRVGDTPLRTMVAQVALIRAAVEFGLRRILVFAARIRDSKDFARTLARTAAMMPPGERPKATLTAGHVDGAQSVSQRGLHLRHLADPPDGGWTVLSSARCLTEGVDVPAVDAVMFTRPKRSEVDVVQALGRALRRHPDGSGIATVLVPVLLPDDPHDSADDLGDWTALWQVLRALRAHDGRLAAALDTQRGQLALGEPGQIPERILLRLPDGYATEDILRHITVRLIEATTSTWAAGHHALTAFRDEHGHVRVPRPYLVGDLDLNSWLRYQVSLGRAGVLAADRAEALHELGVDLSPTRDTWTPGLAAARTFHAAHGHLHPPTNLTIDGVNLYSWLKSRIKADRAGRLAPARAAALDALDPTWRVTRPKPTWERGLAAVTAFHTTNGHLRPPRHTTIDGIDIYDWLAVRRAWFHAGRLRPDHGRALDALDPTWSQRVKIPFADGLAAARTFHAQNGHLSVPTGLRVNGILLQSWLRTMRAKYHAKQLTDDQVRDLEALGIVWSTTDAAWQRGLDAATAFHTEHGHLRVSRQHRHNGVVLATWLERQRRKLATNCLPADHAAALRQLGIVARAPRTPPPETTQRPDASTDT
jgi:superfamily II DNA or RNA helicase